MKRKVAIIGAGWAGLSAAAHLAPHCQVTLFEASRVAGGRARSVNAAPFSFADNGQHLLIGAYRGVWDLLQQVGVDIDQAFVHQPLQWYLADGAQFAMPLNLPMRLALFWTIWSTKSCRLLEKVALLQPMLALQKWYTQAQPDQSVQSWLAAHKVSPKWIAEFWQPLVWSTMNTPLETASLRVLCHVLEYSVWGNQATDCDYLIPRDDLGKAFAEPVLQWAIGQGATWQPATRVGKIGLDDTKIVIENETFDAAILATAPYHLPALLPDDLGDSVRVAIDKLQYHAITTVYLQYTKSCALPALMTGFAHGTAHWLIDRTQINGANEIAAVISVSDQSSLHHTANDWAALIHQDVLRVCPNVGEPIAQQVITEKRATIASSVNRSLPDMHDLNARGIWLAGDWLHSRYPATLEAAVLSGQAAAQSVLRYSGLNLD